MLTATKSLQLEYWTEFREQLSEHEFLRPRKPYPQHWYDFSIGRSGINLACTINTQQAELGAEMYFADDNAEIYFRLLKPYKAEIENELGFQLQWMQLPERRACRIKRKRAGVDFSDRHTWVEYMAWHQSSLEKLYTVFRHRILEIDPTSHRDE